MLSYSISGTYTDMYELTMGEAYFLKGRHETAATFDYFFRKLPYQGGYVVFAGLHELLSILEELRFTALDIGFLESRGFHRDYLEFLESFRFSGNIHSVQEGEIVFPNSPVLRVEGNLFEAQLVETLVLNILNFQSLVATKASRIRQVAGNRLLSDFGLRRAQGLGGVMAARAAMAGGFDSTSNVYAALHYGLPLTGTMAHSYVASYGEEIDAFRSFAETHPTNCIFLVDTYDTLHSGIPNAIQVAKEMEGKGHRAIGIRLDSGDLAWLSRTGRRMLDEAGLAYMKIAVTNQLDEFLVKSLLEQGAPIDIFGVGTKLVTGQPDAALDGVYKLSVCDGIPRLKLSETLQKVTLPGKKQLFRVLDHQGNFWGADKIGLEGESLIGEIYNPYEPGQMLPTTGLKEEALLGECMKNGQRTAPAPGLKEIAAYAAARLARLPHEYKRFENPHVYKVGVSRKLLELRDTLVSQHKKPKK